MKQELQLAAKPYYLGDDLLTPDEVTGWLKTSRSWLKEQCRERTRSRYDNPFPRVKVGKELRFSRLKIAEWLAENEN